MSGKNIFTLAGIWVMIAVISYAALFGITAGGIGIKSIGDSMKLGLDIEGGVVLVYEAKTDKSGPELKALMDQVKAVMEKRINEMGLTEPKVSVSGDKRIRIELPGVADADAAIQQVGKTAKLEFALVNQGAMVQDGVPFDPSMGSVMLTGDNVQNSRYVTDENGRPAVSLEFDKDGGTKFGEMTTLASVSGGLQIAIILDGKVISAPRASKPIPDGNAQITGNFTVDEASGLSALIRGGALPAELVEVQTSIIGPTLGKDSLVNAVMAAKIGFALVVVFMIAYYRMPGVVASISLVLYASLVLFVMVGLGATLTLPGVAGIVLSVGMAVDANVIIFERIREDIRDGKTIRSAVVSGYHKAMRTIMDSNITTIIAAVVLYFMGEGPIRGFAVTLMIGITTSMFTAIIISRTQMMQIIEIDKLNVDSLYGGKKGVQA